MNINEKKEKLINREISISDLSSNEVEKIKKQELKSLNEKIKQMKLKIDNWAN